MLRCVAATAALLWVPVLAAAAQSEPATQYRVVTERLEALAQAEDDYNEIYNVYTDDVGNLKLPSGGDSAPRVILQVVYAGPVGWIAVAWQRDRPNRQCVMYIGNAADLPDIAATAAGTVAEREAEPACDP